MATAIVYQEWRIVLKDIKSVWFLADLPLKKNKTTMQYRFSMQSNVLKAGKGTYEDAYIIIDQDDGVEQHHLIKPLQLPAYIKKRYENVDPKLLSKHFKLPHMLKQWGISVYIGETTRGYFDAQQTGN